ncbi:MAG: endolytic transglycosylase MltG, partial [Muribaculaceae bacterium]|nr:endolytic transglycosylase MltG [Muribaculaceae bacterium]
GLPPGPIRLASPATINAVLDSQPHDYIYMCAKADFSGTHAFARDYATHMANARAYHRALNQRNIHK